MIEVKNRKGISTFIATLLLMVLAVAAGVVIYAYTMGYLGGFGSPTQMGAISVDSASITGVVLTANIRNIGKTTVDPQIAYVVDSTGATKSGTCTSSKMVEGAAPQAYAFTLTGASLTSGMTYNFKIVCADNTQISFPLKMP